MSLSSWVRLMAWIAAEMTVLVAGAAILQTCFRSPRARRILWQAAFTSVALVLTVDFSGLRDKMQGPDLKQHHRFVITATMLPPSGQEAQTDDRAAAVAPVAAPVPSLVKWPGLVWLAGTALLLARSLAARVWLGVRRRAAAPADQDSLRLIARLQISLGLRGVQSQVWSGLSGPVAFGIFRPTIALPPDFVGRFSSAERQAMLAHEMAHLAAHDPFWLMVSDTVIALAWWHPLVWWSRHKLQIASEAAADEASALIPGGPWALAECLVRIGRELTASGPARALGVGGNGPKSQLAARIARLLQEPRIWRPPSAWARWTPHLSAVFIALASAVLPIQTGLSGSILELLATATPAHAENPPAALAPVTVTNQAPTNGGTQAVFIVVTNGTMPLTYQWLFDGSNLSGATLQSNALNPTNNSPPSSENAENIAKIKEQVPVPGDLPLAPRLLTNSPPKVSLLVQTVMLTERESGDIGLDWVFGLAPTNNPSVETSHDWKTLVESPVSQKALNPANNRPKNVTVDILRTGRPAILNPQQFAALRDRILAATQDDFLTAPTVEALSGRQAHIATTDLSYIVNGVEATAGSSTNNAGVNYFTDPVDTGLTADVFPTMEDNDKWRLRVVANFLTFLGYDKPTNNPSVSEPRGKPLAYVLPLPHFRVMEASAEDIVPLGQTLAIRGPLVTETTTIKAHFLCAQKQKPPASAFTFS